MRTFIFSIGILLLSSILTAQNTVPSAVVNDISGNNINISEIIKDGSPKIISLWATWCGPCRMELNALKKVYPDWKTKYNVEIIAISVDVNPMLERAKKMFKSNDWEYTFLHDKNQELMSKLGIRGIPYSMLIDGNGVIKSVQTGYFPGYEKELEVKLKALQN